MAENWIDRERERLASGHYKPVPFGPRLAVPATDARAKHFPHISKDDPALMAYTQSPDKGARDLKTKIKPGTYLKKFFADKFTAPQIATLANEYRIVALPDDTQLLFAETPAECVAAYRACTGSCMSYSSGAGFAGPVHPASIYGSPDEAYVTVAYLKRNDRITAKALVNRQTKKYQSMHGDSTGLTARLNALGYATGYSILTGLKLHAIDAGKPKTRDGRTIFVAPAIDGHAYARHDAASGTLVLLSTREYELTPLKDRVSLGYNRGLTA